MWQAAGRCPQCERLLNWCRRPRRESCLSCWRMLKQSSRPSTWQAGGPRPSFQQAVGLMRCNDSGDTKPGLFFLLFWRFFFFSFKNLQWFRAVHSCSSVSSRTVGSFLWVKFHVKEKCFGLFTVLKTSSVLQVHLNGEELSQSNL